MQNTSAEIYNFLRIKTANRKIETPN